MTAPLQRTPLYDFHARQGARFVPFGGWEMPVQYTSILEEHRATRTAAGLFDVSHMGEVWVEGPQAEAYLDRMVTNQIAGTPVGKATYAILCAEDGGAIDDLIVYRLGPQRFLVCINAGNIDKDVAWLAPRAAAYDLSFRHESPQWGQLALQGPLAESMLQPLTAAPLAGMKKMTAVEAIVAGVPVVLARSGYTGEDGFELYAAAAEISTLAEAVWAAGRPAGLKLCGLGARDSLRLEAGLPLYGHELTSSITPLEAGLGWAVKLAKAGGFIGSEALAAQKAAGLRRQVVFYVSRDRRIARQGMPVWQGGRQVGEVLSGTHSPLLELPIGSALVEATAVATGALEVEVRGARLPVEIVRPPLHKNVRK